MKEILKQIKFGENGLVPAIAQDAHSGRVLMQAYMNREALELTLETRYAHYYSRSRQSLWKKGETSGHVQKVVSIAADCDFDCILMQVEQTGPACHTGERSCFFNGIEEYEAVRNSSVLYELAEVIADRRENPQEGSYTNYLFEKGIDKILKKIGEESAEIIIGSKNEGTDELRYEAADFLYHLLVLMNEKELSLAALFEELQGRR